jgi:antitoxin MazE
MITKLVRHGGDLALVIDQPILDRLGIDAETPLEISTDGSGLLISPVHDDERRKKFEQAVAEVNRKYGKVFKRLAE